MAVMKGGVNRMEATMTGIGREMGDETVATDDIGGVARVDHKTAAMAKVWRRR